MSYTPTTDFLALLRQTGGGVRTERMPGLDYVIAALVRAGLCTVQVGQTAPTVNQSTTVWFKPAASGSWAAEGAVFLYNLSTAQYEPANPVLWSSLLSTPSAPVVVAALPAAAGKKGLRYFVTDATATAFWSIVAGGGANNVPVTSDGTNWRIG